MTYKERKALREICEKAIHTEVIGRIIVFRRKEDAEVFAAARDALPKALDSIETWKRAALALYDADTDDETEIAVDEIKRLRAEDES